MFTNYNQTSNHERCLQDRKKLEMKSCSLISHEPNSLSTFPWMFFSFSAVWQGNLSIVRIEEEAQREREKERGEERMNSAGDWKKFEMDDNVKERTVGESICCPWLEDSHSLWQHCWRYIHRSHSGLVLHFYSVHTRLMNAILIYLSAFPIRHFRKWN